ncbi:DNA-directed RNA polymerase subunit beta [Linum perenne]
MHQKTQVRRGNCIKKGTSFSRWCRYSWRRTCLGKKRIRSVYAVGRVTILKMAVLISERLVYEDIFTSFDIRKYELQTEATSEGPERITREIPHLEAHLLRNLGKNGIVMVGSWVETGDILVGKLTPQSANESSYDREDRLLRTILEFKYTLQKKPA